MLPLISLDSILSDVVVFLPEAILCGTIVVLLLLRMGSGRAQLGSIALIGLLAALATSAIFWSEIRVEAFSRLVISDPFLTFARCVILAGAALTMILSLLTGIPDADDSADFSVMLLGGTLGMLMMASANHLLMVYIAVEMASLPSYALAGFLKGKRRSSEAALKYVIYGGGASGVMIYGISLIAGKFGTGYLPDVASGFAATFNEQAASGGVDLVLVLGSLFLLIGLAFKLSAVPFHFWCPDVFEGASAEVAGFLSVASKAGAVAVTGRILMTLANSDLLRTDLMLKTFGPPLALIAAVTATFGNLAAYSQNNLKRLLAYSTIAHAGYLLMGLAVLSAEGVSAVLFYLAIYVAMNIGAFAVVALIRNQTGSEDISAYRGLSRRAPLLVILMSIFLLSLLGMPPLAGFVAKFQIFAAVYHAADSAPAPWLRQVYYALLVIGGLNTAFSAFYYMRVIKVMILDSPLEEVEGQQPTPLRIPFMATAYTGALAAIVLALGIVVNPLAKASAFSADTLQRTPILQPVERATQPGQGKGKAKGGGKAPQRGQPKGQQKGQPKGAAKDQPKEQPKDLPKEQPKEQPKIDPKDPPQTPGKGSGLS